MCNMNKKKTTTETKNTVSAKKENPFVLVLKNLPFLDYVQLEAITGEISRLKGEKAEEERKRLLRNKEIIESLLARLPEKETPSSSEITTE